VTSTARDLLLCVARLHLRGLLTFGGRPSNNPGRDLRDTLLEAIASGLLVPFPAREHRRPTKGEKDARALLETRLKRALTGSRPIPADLRQLLAEARIARRGRGRPRDLAPLTIIRDICVVVRFDKLRRERPQLPRRAKVKWATEGHLDLFDALADEFGIAPSTARHICEKMNSDR
jgi:hypothetical protein